MLSSRCRKFVVLNVKLAYSLVLFDGRGRNYLLLRRSNVHVMLQQLLFCLQVQAFLFF